MPYIGQPPVTGDTTSSFRLLDNIASYTLTFDGSSSEVVSTTNDTLTFSQHRFVTGQRVTYSDGGGTAIGGLSDGVYYIIKVDQNTISIAANALDAAAGNAIDLTSLGVGTSHTLNIAFDSVNTKFKVTYGNGIKGKVTRAGQLLISINGVIQQPQETSSPSVGFGLEADSTIVFSTAPAPSDVVFGNIIANTITNFDTSDNRVDNFTGDGTTTEFSLSKSVSSNNDILVTIDGVVQYPTDTTTGRSYSVVESTLTFTEAPASSTSIQVRHIGFAGATSSAVTGFYGRTGNVSLSSADDITVQNVTGVAATFTGNVSIAGTLTYEDVTNIDSVGLITARSGIEFGISPGIGASISPAGNAVFAGVVTATSYYGDGSNLTGIDATQIVTGNTSVQTVDTGSDGHIKFNTEGSERARFDSSGNFGLGTTSPSQPLHIATSSGSAYILQTNGTATTYLGPDGSNTGLFGTSTNHDIRFMNNNTERVRIDTSGRMLVGTTTSGKNSAKLQIAGGDNTNHIELLNTSASDTDGQRYSYVWFRGTQSGGEKSSLAFIGAVHDGSSDDESGRLIFHTNDGNDGDSPTERMRIDSSGRLGLNTTSPQADLHIGDGTGNGVEINNTGTLQVIDRGNSRIEPLTVIAEHVAFSIARNTSTTLHDEKARITYNGITFNGDTAAANALDDYEEGTWTPQITSGVTSPTYTTQGGGYVKIGSLVYASWDIGISGGTPNSSQLRFGNFPFASAASAQQTFGAGVISYGIMLDRSTLQNLNLHMSWAGSTIIEVFNGTTNVNGNSSGVNLGAGNRIIATISYRTDS